MASRAPIQGLRISLNFADAQNTVEVLRNLNLDIEDLDIIRGISDTISRRDLQTVSGLTYDLEKQSIALYNETRSYQNILSIVNDGRRTIGGNLQVNGSIIAPTFKFRTVEIDEPFSIELATTANSGTNTLELVSIAGVAEGQTVQSNSAIPLETTVDSISGTTITLTNAITQNINAGELITFSVGNQIRTVDFSTSRASAWSSFGSTSESIFYGGDVVVSGSTSAIELSSLEFANPPIARRFAAQIPTHKIQVSIDGENYDLYAMKGIPIRFKGFFRTVRNLRVDVNFLDPIRPSWIVRNSRTGQEFVYEDRLSGSGTFRQSSINFFDSSADNREIEFYYPVDRITRIDLNNARIFELPKLTLPELQTLNIVNGDLLEMPDVANFYPKLLFLNLSDNDLTRSDDIELKSFTRKVIERLKTPQNTLTSLSINNVYAGQNLSNEPDPNDSQNSTVGLQILTNLQQFICDSRRTNARRMTGESPAIPSGLITYDINGNNFSSLHPSVVESQTLETLRIRNNSISAPIDTSGTSGKNLENIVNFISGRNSHPIVNMSNKENLRVYTTSNQNFSGDRDGSEIFSNCGNLEEIRINNTNVTGNLPDFGSNTSLRLFNSWSTEWNDAVTGSSIGENTFGVAATGGCRPTLESFNLQSRNLIGPIHDSAFRNMVALRNLVVSSYGNGITGPFPTSINNCFKLVTLNFSNNQMSGLIPNFSNNRNLRSISLAQNSFSGTVPAIRLLSDLRVLLLNNNQLTNLLGLDCPNLVTLNLANNLLETIPNFDSDTFTLVRLQTLILNNSINQASTSRKYSPRSLESLTALRRVEISNCGLSQGAVDSILKDLKENYVRNPRRNVLVNLTGNSVPSATDEITGIISQLRSEGWTLGLD